jgi:glycogen phosphorylase
VPKVAVERGPKIRRVGRTVSDFESDLVSNLYYSTGTTVASASAHDAYDALAVTIRDRLIDRRARTTQAHHEANPKFVYYLSAEYLLGPQLRQNVLYTDTGDILRELEERFGSPVAELEALDVEPGLGNGGLGRLAACFMDSLATLDIPAVGYGIRYEFGMFKQAFEDGWQIERPDDWLFFGNPWEFAAPDDRHAVGFGGYTEHAGGGDGRTQVRWVPTETVLGEPSHVLVPGYGTGTVNILRLWRAVASPTSFDLAMFDQGRYAEAVEATLRSENITKVLYPNDTTEAGRELRLKQQYFLVSCSLRDIIRRFKIRNDDWDAFPQKVVVQLNDTHPSLAIPELMRLLVDEHGLDWDRAWSITCGTFAYTCHTLLPEALETWPISMFERLLPRHLEIIYEVNARFLDEVRTRHPDDNERIARLSIIQEGAERRVRMANLAVVGTFAVNGVAELHSRLLADRTLRDFAELWPEKFRNVTNGVTPRRFLRLANPRLSELATTRLGDERWLIDLEQLRRLEPLATDAAFQKEWRDIKRHNKQALAALSLETTGIEVDPASMFDVMVKRLHEYKRQLLKVLHIITLYHQIAGSSAATPTPRTFVFGAKAAPGYQAAKRVIKLINSVAAVVNSDPTVGQTLRVVFLPNYNVSVAEIVVPAADLSEQISLAGTEASGTGNMKMTLNGALTIGTLDGANIEIREQVGADNFFLFGMTADEVFARRDRGYSPREFYEADDELRAAVDAIAEGDFSDGDKTTFEPIVSSLLGADDYMVLADYRAYVDRQDDVEAAWADDTRWTTMSVLNSVRAGLFSSDRAIRDYCADIWDAQPVPVAPPR